MAQRQSSRLEVPTSTSRPPRASKVEISQHSRSRQHVDKVFRDLRDISPAQALQAFTVGSLDVQDENRSTKLSLDLTGISQIQKQLGIRVAQAAERLQFWVEELETWRWTGRFVTGSSDCDAAQAKDDWKDVEHALADLDTTLKDPGHTSRITMPEMDVVAHETRIDQIRRDLEILEFDELKVDVLDMHRTRSRPGSSYSTFSSCNTNAILDDGDILVTHTTLQALPHLEMLRQLLNIWTLRLSVMRQAPHFLASLCSSQHLWNLGRRLLLLCDGQRPDTLTLDHVHRTTNRMLSVLQTNIKSLGRTLDNMLDLCEGCEKIPDRWIDEYEVLEGDYAQLSSEVWNTLIRLRSGEHGIRNHTADTPRAKYDVISQSPAEIDTKFAAAAVPTSSMKVEVPLSTEMVLSKDVPSAVALYFENAVSPWNEPENSPTWSDCASPLEITTPASARPNRSKASETQDEFSTHALNPNDQGLSHIASPIEINSGRQKSSEHSATTEPPAELSSKSTWKPRQAPLNAVMTKRRKKFRDSSKTKSPSLLAEKSADAYDLDQQISDILQTLPTAARLSTGGSDIGEAKRPSNDLKIGKTRNRTPSLTLARAVTPLPAASSIEHRDSSIASRSSTAARRYATNSPGVDGDTKLYYLTSSARPGIAPLKLFLRRVGEHGERVMVRVGGGWADLGEYLRSYVEHHGRRTVSESSYKDNSLNLVPGYEEHPPLPPLSQDLGAGSHDTSSSPLDNFRDSTPRTPSKSPSSTNFLSHPDNDLSLVANATPPSATSLSSTALRSFSNPAEIGLAGRVRRTQDKDLSQEKQEWISDMVEKARQGVGSGTNPPMFQSLGQAGNTKRVILRKSSSRVGT